MKRLLIAFGILIHISVIAQNYENYDYRDKAQAIYMIAQETQWLNETEFDEYFIIIFSKDDNLYNFLDTIKQAGRKIKNKDANLKHISNIDEILHQPRPEIIYISEDYLKYTDTISTTFDLPGVMIITDNAPDNKNFKFSVNFLKNNTYGKLFELNDNEALRHGLRFSERLLLLGGNEDILREMYTDTVRNLRIEIEELTKQIYIVQEQQRIIDLKKEQLKILENQIDSQKTEAEVLKNSIKQISASLELKKNELAEKQKILQEQETKIQAEKQKFEELEAKLTQKEVELEQKEQKIEHINEELSKAIKRIQTQADFIKLAILILMALIFTIYLYIHGRKKNRQIQEKNRQITKINEELKSQQIIIEEKNTALQQTLKEITWSLNYAHKLQLALLPTEEQLNKFFKDYFLISMPRDIVSGDFYYTNQINKYKIFAVGDCTGHGVAGGFLSIMSITTLHEILKVKKINQTGTALNIMRERIKEMFKHFGSDNSHGLDMALCAYDTENKILQFSGAYSSIFIYHNNELVEYKGTRNPIGNYPVEQDFETKEIPIKKGDIIYLFTDGYYDQLQKVAKGKAKFSKTRLKNLINKIADLPLKEQKRILIEEYKKWSGDEEQTDDITILAVKLI